MSSGLEVVFDKAKIVSGIHLKIKSKGILQYPSIKILFKKCLKYWDCKWLPNPMVFGSVIVGERMLYLFPLFGSLYFHIHIRGYSGIDGSASSYFGGFSFDKETCNCPYSCRKQSHTDSQAPS